MSDRKGKCSRSIMNVILSVDQNMSVFGCGVLRFESLIESPYYNMRSLELSPSMVPS